MIRLAYPPGHASARGRERFDPVVEGARHRLPAAVALAIWERARADAVDGAGALDAAHAERRFHELAAEVAARGGRLRVDVGKRTRVGDALEHEHDAAEPADEDWAPRAPGRDTRVLATARGVRGPPTRRPRRSCATAPRGCASSATPFGPASPSSPR